MRKQMKRFLAGILAAACTFSSLSVDGLYATAAEGNAADTPWQSVRYELEDGRTFKGEGATQDIKITSGSQYSKGKAVDTMDHNGNGAGVAIEPVLEHEGLYEVTLGYSKGIAYDEGQMGLYRNEECVGRFYTYTTANKGPYRLWKRIRLLFISKTEMN